MVKSTYSFGKNAKEKAKRLKQIEKAAKRLAARKQKTDLKPSTTKEDQADSEVHSGTEIVNDLPSDGN